MLLVPKAPRHERERGLADAPKHQQNAVGPSTVTAKDWDDPDAKRYERNSIRANVHPTVKPIDLMRHLVRLVTPPAVDVLECMDCGRIEPRPNVSRVRADVPPANEANLLLDSVSGELAAESAEGVQGVRQVLPPSEQRLEGTEAGSLLESMREPSVANAPSGMPGVWDEVPPQEQGSDVLLSELFSDGERPQASGVDEDGARVHLGVESDAPERHEIGVRLPTPSDHGRRAGTGSAPDGSRGSHQRSEGRQPGGEPTGARKDSSRQSAEASPQADHLPALPVDDLSLGTCAACGGSLAARSRPGVVLDPFAGSGTTALACSEEGFRNISIEREAEYLDIAKARLMATPMGLGLNVPLTGRRDIGRQRGNKDAEGNETLKSVRRDDQHRWDFFQSEDKEPWQPKDYDLIQNEMDRIRQRDRLPPEDDAA